MAIRCSAMVQNVKDWGTNPAGVFLNQQTGKISENACTSLHNKYSAWGTKCWNCQGDIYQVLKSSNLCAFWMDRNVYEQSLVTAKRENNVQTWWLMFWCYYPVCRVWHFVVSTCCWRVSFLVLNKYPFQYAMSTQFSTFRNIYLWVSPNT